MSVDLKLALGWLLQVSWLWSERCPDCQKSGCTWSCLLMGDGLLTGLGNPAMYQTGLYQSVPAPAKSCYFFSAMQREFPSIISAWLWQKKIFTQNYSRDLFGKKESRRVAAGWERAAANWTGAELILHFSEVEVFRGKIFSVGIGQISIPELGQTQRLAEFHAQELVELLLSW